MANNKIKPITLEIEKEMWDEFKNEIPRTISLNQAIVLLIKQHLIKKERIY